jgi:hypothetical protein
VVFMLERAAGRCQDRPPSAGALLTAAEVLVRAGLYAAALDALDQAKVSGREMQRIAGLAAQAERAIRWGEPDWLDRLAAEPHKQPDLPLDSLAARWGAAATRRRNPPPGDLLCAGRELLERGDLSRLAETLERAAAMELSDEEAAELEDLAERGANAARHRRLTAASSPRSVEVDAHRDEVLRRRGGEGRAPSAILRFPDGRNG